MDTQQLLRVAGSPPTDVVLLAPATTHGFGGAVADLALHAGQYNSLVSHG